MFNKKKGKDKDASSLEDFVEKAFKEIPELLNSSDPEIVKARAKKLALKTSRMGRAKISKFRIR